MLAKVIHDQQFSDKTAVCERSYLTGDHSKSNAKQPVDTWNLQIISQNVFILELQRFKINISSEWETNQSL